MIRAKDNDRFVSGWKTKESSFIILTKYYEELLLFCVFFFFLLDLSVIKAQEYGDFVESAKSKLRELKVEYNKGAEVQISFKIDEQPETLSRVYVCGDFEINQEYKSGGVEEDSIEVINKDYAFQLTRTNPSSKWTIQKIYDRPQYAREAYTQFNHGVLPISCLLYSGIMVDDSWFENILTSKTIEITSVVIAKSDSNGKNIAEVTFRGRHNLDKYNAILGGKFYLDVNNYYVILRCEYDIELSFTTKNNKEVKETIHVRRVSDYEIIEDIPFPKRIEYEYVPQSRPTSKSVIEFSSSSRKLLDNKEFYLSHYGFSEPPNPTKRGNTIRMVFIVSGLILIGISLYLRYKASKA